MFPKLFQKIKYKAKVIVQMNILDIYHPRPSGHRIVSVIINDREATLNEIINPASNTRVKSAIVGSEISLKTIDRTTAVIR